MRSICRLAFDTHRGFAFFSALPAHISRKRVGHDVVAAVVILDKADVRLCFDQNITLVAVDRLQKDGVIGNPMTREQTLPTLRDGSPKDTAADTPVKESAMASPSPHVATGSRTGHASRSVLTAPYFPPSHVSKCVAGLAPCVVTR